MARKKTRKPARRPARSRRPARKSKRVQPVPPKYGAVTPMLHIRGCAAALDFYPRAFGAKVVSRTDFPNGKVMHAELRFGDRIVMAAEEAPEMGGHSPQALGGTSGGLMLYVRDCDKAHARAVAAGCTSTMAPADMFWGDRFSSLIDPYGHQWSLATHKVDLTPREMAAAAKAFIAAQPRPPPGPEPVAPPP